MDAVQQASADAIVVAAGSSRRMGGVDKILASLCGRPLLAWTLEALRKARAVRRLILVVGADRMADLSAADWLAPLGAELVAGGPRRQESVAAGVAVADAPLVLVHDGARPLVSPELVDLVARATLEHGAAIPVLPIAETLKAVRGGRVERTVERDGLAAAQTPQGVRRETLLMAYARYPADGERVFTDEAALLEAAGVPVAAVPGEAANLKVTVPEDLARAESLLAGRLGGARTGFGTDAHPFGPEMGLALGGILIDHAPRLHGHSDGDAALHALCDALLGAAGLGDIGRLFPPGDPATRGIASRRLLEGVVERLAAAGYRPDAVDLTITAGRPMLGAQRLERMRSTIAAALGVPDERVCVKANSGNLSGYEGAGRGIAAAAIASVVPVPGPATPTPRQPGRDAGRPTRVAAGERRVRGTASSRRARP